MVCGMEETVENQHSQHLKEAVWGSSAGVQLQSDRMAQEGAQN